MTRISFISADQQNLKMECTQESLLAPGRSLVLASDFALNNSITKKLSVGIDLTEKIEPAVQIYGTDQRKRITLRAATWVKLEQQLEHILNYFADPDPDLHRTFRIIECDDLVVTFSVLHNHKCVIFDQNQIRLAMHAVTIQNLYSKVSWINQWLDVLYSTPLQKHLDILVNQLPTSCGLI